MNRLSRTLKSLYLLAGLIVGVAAPMSASAQAVPPDEVRTTDGGVFRGVIVENVPGDHLTILLPTGESRRIPAAEVASTGVVMPTASAGPTPAAPTEANGAAPAPAGPGEIVGSGELRVEVQSVTPGLTLHAGAGYGSSLQRICFERCELRMNRGVAVFAVQDASGRMRFVPGNHLIQQHGHLDFEVNSRRGARIGMGLSGLGLGLLSLVFFIPDFNQEWDPYGYGTSLKMSSFAAGMGLAGTGAMLMGMTAIVRDNGRVRFTPYGTAGAGGVAASGSF